MSNTLGRYKIGERYETLSGDFVEIVQISDETVLGSDGVWRYDREGRYENGRTTGTTAYPPDLRNFKNGAWLKHSADVVKIMQFFEPGERSSIKNAKYEYNTLLAKKRCAIALDTLLDKASIIEVFEVFDLIKDIK